MILSSLVIVRPCEDDTDAVLESEVYVPCSQITDTWVTTSKRREVLFANGSSRCSSGVLDLGWAQEHGFQQDVFGSDNHLTFSGVSRIVPFVEDHRDELEFLGTVDEALHSSDSSSYFSAAAQAILTVVEELADEVLGGDTIADALGIVQHIFKWVDDDDATTYFELRLGAHNSARGGLVGVEAAACKVYSGAALITVIYFEESFYFLLSDANKEEQSLQDSFFPDLSRRSACYHIPAPADHFCGINKLVLWLIPPSLEPQSLASFFAEDEEASGVRSNARCAGSNVGSGVALLGEAEVEEGLSLAADGTYSQSYCVLTSARSQEDLGADSPCRLVFFRMGYYCYSGAIQLPATTNSANSSPSSSSYGTFSRISRSRTSTVPLRLGSLPSVASHLQSQQSLLTYECASSKVGPSSPFLRPMQHLHKVQGIVADQLLSALPDLAAVLSASDGDGNGSAIGSVDFETMEADSELDTFFELSTCYGVGGPVRKYYSSACWVHTCWCE